MMGTCTQPIKYAHTCMYIPPHSLGEWGSCLRDLITSSSGLLWSQVWALRMAYCLGFIFPRLTIFFCSLIFILWRRILEMVSFFCFKTFQHSNFRTFSPISGFHSENALSVIRPTADDGPPVAISMHTWECVLGKNVSSECYLWSTGAEQE